MIASEASGEAIRTTGLPVGIYTSANVYVWISISRGRYIIACTKRNDGRLCDDRGAHLLFDNKGKKISELVFDDIDDYYPGGEVAPTARSVPIVQRNGRWYGVSAQGELTDDPRDGDIYQHCTIDGVVKYSVVYKNGLMQLHNVNDRPINDDLYDRLYFGNTYVTSGGQPTAKCENPLSVKHQGEWKYLAKNREPP